MSLTPQDMQAIERIVSKHVDELAVIIEEDVVAPLDRIERTILANHESRIKRIEDALVIPPSSKLRAAI